MIKVIKIIVAIVMLAVSLWPGSASKVEAAIINVPADQPTIQTGIDAAVNGDTVLVAEGTYYENIIFRGKEILLSSHFHFDKDPAYIFNTIINGSQPEDYDSASVVRIIDYETSQTVLQGFTITGGTGTKWPDPHGAGDYREGGGILCEFSSPVIRFNYIVDNVATDTSGSMTSAGGGGIRAGDGDPLIVNNIIIRNKGRYGAGLVLNYAEGMVTNNIIAENSGGEDFGGAGIWAYKGGLTTIINNTIVKNVVLNSLNNPTGGGIYIWSTDATIKNNIIRNNIAPSQAQLGLQGGLVNLSYCNIENGYFIGSNITDEDPEFVGSFYYLSPSSPSIDGGDPDNQYFDIFDNGIRWPSRGIFTNDLGAYGGPGAYPFEAIAIFSDSTYGWAPFTTSFYAESIAPYEEITWNFGDNHTSNENQPIHTFNKANLYDVSASFNLSGHTFTSKYDDFILSIGDTIIADTGINRAGSEAVITIRAVNSMPVNEFRIPIEYGKSFIAFDSFSTVGCRTEYFEIAKVSHLDLYFNRLTVTLKSTQYDPPNELPPGNGEILKVYFRIIPLTPSGAYNDVNFDGYGNHIPGFYSSYMNYNVPGINGGVEVSPCCWGIRGNVDFDQSEIIDIDDLVYLIEFGFGIPAGPSPACMEEADVDNNGLIDIDDVILLIDYAFGYPSGPPPADCPY